MWGSLHAPCVACPLYRVGMQVEDQDVAQLAGEKSRNHEIFCWEQELDQKASTAYLVPLLKEPLQKELLPACRQKPHLHIACKVQPPTSRNTWPKKRVFKNGMASMYFQKKKKKKTPNTCLTTMALFSHLTNVPPLSYPAVPIFCGAMVAK
jgi:hypothetical protein